MIKIKIATIAVLLAVWIIPLVSYSQPTINGELTGTLGPGEYIVEGNCMVPFGNTLTIEPGTTLLFSGYYMFSVYGQLNAEGTTTDSIKFIRQFPTEDCTHGGLRFLSGSSESSSLSYCWIDYATNQDFPFFSGGGICCNNVGITISNCCITNCSAEQGGGLYGINAPLNISACVFEADTSYEHGGGIYAYNSAMVITDCVFSGNVGTGGGLYASVSPLTITNCTFESNDGVDGGGLYASDSPVVVTNCIFEYNQAENGGGLLLSNSDDAEVSYCLICRNSSTSD